MTSGARFLFYTNELVGFGHLRRQLALAARLSAMDAATTTSLIVTGSPVEPYFSLPPGVDAVKLPTRTRDETGNHTGALLVELSELQDLRSKIALVAAMAFRPTVMVVDKLPLGPAGELLPTLEAIRASSHCKVVLGLRDLDDSPERVRANWGDARREILERYYDAILVYGPAGTPDALDCMGWHDLRVPVAHVGYVSPALPTPAPADVQARYVLATAGSGRSGFTVLSAFLQALALAPLHCRSIILTGPLMDPGEKEQLHAMAAGLDVEVWEFRTDIASLISGALGVVGMAGYNTVAESVQARKPLLLVPRVRPGQEQLIRARFLAERGLVDMIHPDELTPATMRSALDRLVTRVPAPWRAEHFHGTDRAAEILWSLARGAGNDSIRLSSSQPEPVHLPAVGEPVIDGGRRALAVWAQGSGGLELVPERGTAGSQ